MKLEWVFLKSIDQSIDQIIDCSGAAMHGGVLITDGGELDHYHIDILVYVATFLDNCDLVNIVYSVAYAFLHEHLFFMRVARILMSV